MAALCIGVNLCFRQDAIANAMVEKFGRDEINLSISQKRRKVFLNLMKFEKTGSMFGLKLDQHINITIGAEVIAKNRAE